MNTNTKEKQLLTDTVATRVRGDLRTFYEEIARKEGRDLSEILRFALEGYAVELKERGGRLERAA